MQRYVDECVCCDLPCINCGRKNVLRTECDYCGDIVDDYYDIDGEDVCPDCAMDVMIKNHFDTAAKIRDYFQNVINDERMMSDDEKEEWMDDFDKQDENAQLTQLKEEELDAVCFYLGVKLRRGD